MATQAIAPVLLVEDGVPKSKSYEAIRDTVLSALQNLVRVEQNNYESYCWIQNLYPTKVVYSVGGKLFMRDYSIAKDGITFGGVGEVELSYTAVEAVRTLVAEAMQLNEAFDTNTGEVTITVIKPGFNKSKGRYYPAEMLKRDYKIFEGAKMFADHQTDKEAKARPEGSVRDWVGNIKKLWVENDGTVKAKAQIIDPPFKAKLTELSKNNLLTEMGVSIRAIGSAVKKKIEEVNTNYVESLLSARSVDFVTFAGAGGQVEAIESDGENDVDLVTEAQLRERRPDLVKLFESSKEEAMKTVEQRLTEAEASLAVEKARADAAEAKVKESDIAAKKSTAGVELTKLLIEAKLPEMAQTRIKKQFADATETTGMKEAVDAEAAYIKSIGGNGAAATTGSNVRNMGATDNVEEGADPNKNTEKPNLVESFKSLGLPEAAAKVAAAAR